MRVMTMTMMMMSRWSKCSSTLAVQKRVRSQTVQFLVHTGTRMIVQSWVAMPVAASSKWTVLRRRSCEDRSGLCVSPERRCQTCSWAQIQTAGVTENPLTH